MKIEDSLENGTYYVHPQARDYLMQQHRNSEVTPQLKEKWLHPNIPARTYTNKIH
jgi:hypothetical protein